MSALGPVLTDVRSRLAPFAREVATEIRREVPGYAGMTPDEHLAGVESQLRAILGGLLSHRLPTAAQVAQARELGARRAELGVPLQDVVTAYHLAYPAIWRELRARAGTPVEQRALLAEVEFVWSWLHLLSAAVAEGHVEESTERATERAALMRRLVTSLAADGDQEPENAARLLGQLGFEATDAFVALCARGLSVIETEALESLLAGPDRVVRAVRLEDCSVVLTQGWTATALAEAVSAGATTKTAGVGRSRLGPAGAAETLRDARDALGRAGLTGAVTTFDEDWAGCALEGARARLEPYATIAAEIVAQSPHLAETVRAYAASGFSISQCARALQIHPNSAKYRLDRWHRVTGWDPATYAGLQRSMVALDCCGFAP
ncbi:helix-turn-helix domain-containing protein [Nocardioides sp. LHD-245]|uniref:PucR family transcriptional regulator n=1 Tax=Nocardioides sp. LHD-245 TaxID=3051387 RepID=UPI0027DEC2ED|nr:helix-turn-helix domain-containing protein [Nocardioides sp. LHD-245]